MQPTRTLKILIFAACFLILLSAPLGASEDAYPPFAESILRNCLEKTDPRPQVGAKWIQISIQYEARVTLIKKTWDKKIIAHIETVQREILSNPQEEERLACDRLLKRRSVYLDSTEDNDLFRQARELDKPFEVDKALISHEPKVTTEIDLNNAQLSVFWFGCGQNEVADWTERILAKMAPNLRRCRSASHARKPPDRPTKRVSAWNLPNN